MHETQFEYRLVFLTLFMASVMTWGWIVLLAWMRGDAGRIGPLVLRPVPLGSAGLVMVLGCGLLDFMVLLDRDTLLQGLVVTGLVMPWTLLSLSYCWQLRLRCH